MFKHVLPNLTLGDHSETPPKYSFMSNGCYVAILSDYFETTAVVSPARFPVLKNSCCDKSLAHQYVYKELRNDEQI